MSAETQRPPPAARHAGRTAWWSGAAPVLVACGLSLSQPPFLQAFNGSVYDALLAAAGPSLPTGHVVIVDIDERSLAVEGQWPWSRDRIGQLIARLRDSGALAVGVDILFAEEDRHRGLGVTPEATTRMRPDARLAEILREGGVVLGYAATFSSETAVSAKCVLHPLGLATVRRARTPSTTPFFRATGAICPLPELARAADSSGFINAAADRDGVFRRVPLVMELDGRPHPALALATVLAAKDSHGVSHVVRQSGTSFLRFADHPVVPLGDRGTALVRFRGKKGALPRVSAADVLAGRHDPADVHGKLIFVGTTALGTHDLVRTPFDATFSGVEVHATVADNLLAGDLIVRHGFGNLLDAVVVLLVGVATIMACRRFGLLGGATTGGLGLVIIWSGSILLLDTRGVLLSPLYPSLGVALVMLTTVVDEGRARLDQATHADLSHSPSRALMVQSLLSLTELRDAETGRHSQRTQRLTELLAGELSTASTFTHALTPERIRLMASLAPLHDIGKVGVPDHILRKPGPLTSCEVKEMRRHPEYGREVICRAQQQLGLDDDEVLTLAKDIVSTHHERWDGTGYPARLSGTQIPVAGRVLAIVDFYDAAVTRAFYQPRLSHAEAVRFIVERAGTHFDPDVVAAFVRVSSRFERQTGE